MDIGVLGKAVINHVVAEAKFEEGRLLGNLGLAVLYVQTKKCQRQENAMRWLVQVKSNLWV